MSAGSVNMSSTNTKCTTSNPNRRYILLEKFDNFLRRILNRYYFMDKNTRIRRV